MGYHKREIERGEYYEFSKIKEEFEELEDAYEQDDKVLQLCEMSDMMGAVEGYLERHFRMELNDLIKFKEKTKSAFVSGKRK